MDLLFFYKFMIWLDQDSKGASLNRGLGAKPSLGFKSQGSDKVFCWIDTETTGAWLNQGLWNWAATEVESTSFDSMVRLDFVPKITDQA